MGKRVVQILTCSRCGLEEQSAPSEYPMKGWKQMRLLQSLPPGPECRKTDVLQYELCPECIRTLTSWLREEEE